MRRVAFARLIDSKRLKLRPAKLKTLQNSVNTIKVQMTRVNHYDREIGQFLFVSLV